jgi:hypothetical protein
MKNPEKSEIFGPRNPEKSKIFGPRKNKVFSWETKFFLGKQSFFLGNKVFSWEKLNFD